MGAASVDHEPWLEQHDRMIADLDRAMAESRENHDREMAEIREAQKQLVADVGLIVRRAIRLGVREDLIECPKRRELDEKNHPARFRAVAGGAAD